MGHRSRIKERNRRDTREAIGPFYEGFHLWNLLFSRTGIIALRADSKLGRYLPLILWIDSGRKDRSSFCLRQLDLSVFPPERLRRYPLKSISRITIWTDQGVIDVYTIEGTCDRYRMIARRYPTLTPYTKTLKKLYSTLIPLEERPGVMTLPRKGKS
jgi:hypothetical protein